MSLKLPQVQGFEPSHPKKTLEAKQKQYYVVGAPMFFGDCVDIALLYKYIWWWAMFFSGAEKVFKKPSTADPMFFF